MKNPLFTTPGSTCPAHVLQLDKSNRITTIVCGKRSTATGFCVAHAHTYRLLQAVHEADYPAASVNDYLYMPGGVETWEELILNVAPPGEWFALTPQHVERLRKERRKSRYEQIMEALARRIAQNAA